MPTVDARFVREHEDFLRRLARGLLAPGHEDEVDDAVQETWRRSLVAAPRSAPRGYLGAVLRHTLGRARARERDRAQVERHAARPERLEDDVTRHLALHEELARALRALPEAQRTALFLRFHGDLTLAEIARRTGAPVPTVKTRITRGLRAMRAELDTRHGGDRASWATLVGFALDGRGSLATARGFLGGLLGGHHAALALAAAACVTWLAVAVGGGSSETGGASVELASASPSVEPVPQPSTLEPLPPAARAAAPPLVRRGPAPDEDPGVAQVRARVVDDAGNPVEGVVFSTSLRVRSDATLYLFGAWPTADPVVATSAADGTVGFTLRAYPCVEWRLSVTPPEHARVARTLGTLARDAEQDLGEVVLQPAGALEVTVVDAAGERVLDSRQVDAYQVVHRGPGDRARVEVSADTAGGLARLTGLPPGQYSVIVGNDRTEAVVHAGVTTAAVLRLEPETSAESLVAFVPFELRGHVSLVGARLVGADGIAQPPTSVDEALGRAVWSPVAPGTHTLEVEVPGFAPWSLAGVGAGSRVPIELQLDSGVRLTVTDREGTPVGIDGGVNVARLADLTPFELEALAAGAFLAGERDMRPLHLHRTPLPPGTLLPLKPGDHRLAVFGPRAVRVEVDVLGLGLSEVRDLVVVVDPTRRVTGRALDAAGAPVRGAQVELLAAADEADGPDSPVMGSATFGTPTQTQRAVLAEATTGADGRFEWTTGHVGRLVVRASEPLGLRDTRRRFGLPSAWLGAEEAVVPAEAPEAHTELVLPGRAEVTGRVAGLAHGEPGFELVLAPRAPLPEHERAIAHEMLRPASLGAGGTFRFIGVAPGAYTLTALLGGQPFPFEHLPRRARVVAEVDVPFGGAHGIVLTPSAPLPTPVVVRVVSSEAPSGEWCVLAAPTGVAYESPAAAVFGAPLVHVGTEGRATLPLGPGGAWTLVVQDLADGGSWRRDVVLEPGSGEVELALEVVAGTVQVVDAAGAPRARVRVAGAQPSFTELRGLPARGARTDEGGLATLRLPAGPVVLDVAGHAGPVGPLDWPPPPGTTVVVPDPD